LPYFPAGAGFAPGNTQEKQGGAYMSHGKELTPPTNFIRTIVSEDTESGKWGGRVHTRFPPEPNGYLHIGHAKSICLNFGIAAEFGGKTNLRFDDTNPSKEEVEYVDSIKEDVRWLGFDWEDREYYASDYFEQLYEHALTLIKKGLAYVDSLSAEEIREYRGTLTSPGRESPYRDRGVEENLDLFRRMRAGEFNDGDHVLRARIDMAAPNMVMRDPTLYRIKHVSHHRTGDDWCIYPMYDFTHCISDSIEGITHSLCTLEFEINRQLYDWILEKLDIYHPQQIEFARLNLTHTVLSKRKLIRLVEEGHVAGWDDPRMPTISGFRRRGYTPRSIRTFCERIGVARADNLVEFAMLEACLREDLNDRAPRMMGVVDPLKVVIENYPRDQVEEFEFPYHPEKPGMGSRRLPFARELWVDRADFREEAPRKWFRLAPGKEVRLRYAYYVTCTDVIKDGSGRVVELRCTYDPETRGGWSDDGRKVKGTLHWLSARHAVPAEIRLYESLFTQADPGNPDPGTEAGQDFTDFINPDSLRLANGFVEPGLADPEPLKGLQFERTGYFCADPDSAPGRPVFNRTATLRDSWARIEKKTT
jgi:glutaminyl-tRNA synthetase